MKEIILTQGFVALVDDADYEQLKGYRWYVHIGPTTVYARRDENRKKIYMHRQILRLQDSSTFADHIDGDGLNNQRSNLRVATSSENQRNRRISPANRSGFKGVCWNSGKNKWQATLKLDRKVVAMRRFDCPIKAAMFYDDAARYHFGERATLNFPKNNERAAL